MRLLPPSTLAVLAIAFSTSACRDEQAGPKAHAQAPGSAPTRAAPTPAPAPSGPVVLDQAPAKLSFRSGATWAEGAIRYLGTTFEPAQPQPGQPVTLSHFFEATKAPPAGWNFFMHVVDPGSGQMIANADHPFAQGALELSNWPVGKVVVDRHSISWPAQPSRIVLGFWQGDQRLPVDNAKMQDGQSRVLGPVLGPQAPQLPEYTARKVARPPTVDGELNDPAWAQAEEVELQGSFDGRPMPLRTTARIVYDDQHLYVAFDAADPDVWGTLQNRDDPIYTQEVVEVFLDANADERTYNELQVSPNNVIFDAYFPARRQGMDTSWDSKMQTAVKVNGTVNNADDRDSGWTAEMKIPYSTLSTVPSAPPKAGDRWRFNLYRLELPDRKSQQGYAFSPLFVGDFHALPRFGTLIFEK